MDNIENLVVSKVTKGGGEPGPLVEGVFVDPQDNGAVETDAFLGFALGELVVDPLDGGASYLEDACQSRSADAVVMLSVGAFAEGLAAMPAGENSRQWRNEGVSAIPTA